MIAAINNCIHPKGGENLEVMEMSDKELIATTIDRYTDLQQIKKLMAVMKMKCLIILSK